MIDPVYVPGRGSLGATLMVLGEAPSFIEVQTGIPFTGPSGKELDRLFQDSGIKRSDIWLTNVCKYQVPLQEKGSKIPFTTRCKMAGIDIDIQLKELQEEIKSVQPNCILALGGTALWSLCGKTKISKFRGSIMHGMGVKFVPTYHPAHLLHTVSGGEIKGYWNRQVMVFDFKRAHKQSQFPELRLPSRVIEICRNSAQLAEFRDRYKSSTKMSVDIEADGTCIPVCVGLACNKHHSIVVPLWNCNGISSIPDTDLVQIWIILAELLYEKEIIGQNFNYDRDKLRRLGFVIRKLASDTMLKAHAINPELPKGLAFNTSLFTEEPFYKDEGMYQGSVADLMIGCGRDACVTYEIDENMEKDLDELEQREFFENFLMQLPDLYYSIERQGFKIDSEERDRLIRKYIEWDERLRYELYKLVGTEVNVNSPKQINSLLWDNLNLPRKDTTGEEDLTSLLNSPTAIKKPEHRKIVELILEDRRVRKSISTYLMALPDFDGRMRTTYFPCLDTGRTSTGQQDPPIRPSIEVIDENGKKKNKVLGTAFQTMTKHGDIGSDIRGMYIPDSSHIEFIGWDNQPIIVQEDEVFDSSQAEARVVAVLSNDIDTLRMYDEHDIHALTASWFFGGKEEDYSKKILGYEHPTRFAGKTLRHAGHLGAGKRRASIEVNTQARKYKIPIAITEAIAEHALRIFHAKSPKVQKVFQAEVIECLKRSRSLIAPVPYGVCSAHGGKRIFYERFGEELFRQGFSYIPQRAVSDNTKAAALRIRQKILGIKIVMESHDALLFSIPVSKVNEWSLVIKEEMERPIDFSRCSLPRNELSIPCDIETGLNYKDLKKLKDIPIIASSKKIIPTRELTPTEQFLA